MLYLIIRLNIKGSSSRSYYLNAVAHARRTRASLNHVSRYDASTATRTSLVKSSIQVCWFSYIRF